MAADGLLTFVWIALGWLYIGGSFALFACMQIITRDAGFSSPQKRWSLMRRTIYMSAALAFFMLGVWRLEHVHAADPWEAFPELILIFYVTVFPILRAVNVITQDKWTAGNGVSRMLDDAAAHGRSAR